MTTVFLNGQIFQGAEGNADAAEFHAAMVVRDGLVQHVGSASDAAVTAAVADAATTTHDLQGRTVLPGFTDGHVHLLSLGYSLKKAPLESCTSLADIRAVIRAYATAHPEVPRILCRNWMFSMTPGPVTAAMLDDLDPRPIYIESKDLHATWCNTAALKDLGLWDAFDHEIKGGDLHRDPVTRRPSGLLSEAYVFDLVWPHLSTQASLAERTEALTAAVDAYTAHGYTGVVDMALQDESLEAMLHYAADCRARTGRGPPLRFAAYWLVKPKDSDAEHLAQVDRAIALMHQYGRPSNKLSNLPDLRIVGIKIVCDGIVDACTAALTEPYGDSARTAADTIWSPAMLAPVVRRATEGGLQVALHAIGDAAVTMAIDAIAANPGQAALRPRIEHLELTTPDDARRLGQLGITASIQPVHADPAILRAWPTLLGTLRCGRAFAYKDFADAGAPLAIGTDAPTAPYAPLHNAYIATTRRSAREPATPDLAPVNPEFALGLCATITAASRGAAYSVFADTVAGTLGPGKAADFSVVDMAWDAQQLLAGRNMETWFGGQQVWSRGE